MSTQKKLSLALLLVLLIGGIGSLLVDYLAGPNTAPRKKSSLSFSILSAKKSKDSKGAAAGNSVAGLPSVDEPSATTFSGNNTEIVNHINKVLAYIYSNTHPQTYLSYSLPGDKRLSTWSVVYDDAMRAMAHLITGDIQSARRTMDYFIENTAIQKIGWIKKNGRLVPRSGWMVNIVDAAETRPGGRGIEHIAHVGPNVFLGIAAVHLYRATGDKKYLIYARERWVLLHELQNEDPKDVNYGGIRMGPLGNPDNPQEQKIDFKRENPSFYELYNGEHAADFMAFCDIMEIVDPKNRAEYVNASRLIKVWDKRIFDKKNNLFFIGTTEKKFFEPNIGQWVGPGVMEIRPLDTSALKLSAYGVTALEQFGPNAAVKIRKAIDDHFKNTLMTRIGGSYRKVTGYDFIADIDRDKLIRYVEEGPMGDVKVKKGMGRIPMISDEWSNWVAQADLRLAKDFAALGDNASAAKYWASYRRNALGEAFKTADILSNTMVAYPYAHPIPEAFNLPVGFGWNTHHSPYSVIGGSARIMGFLGFDSFHLDKPLVLFPKSPIKFQFAQRMAPRAGQTIITEAEEYINRAWSYVALANRHGPDEMENWSRAAAIVERMLAEHPDWAQIAAQQNKRIARTDEKFPLKGMGPLTPKDLEPVYRQYWALYHIGTGQFIRVMSYSRIATMYKKKNQHDKEWAAESKLKSAATQIIQNYSYSQAFDDANGWMWQPISSLREYVNPTVLNTIDGYKAALDAAEKTDEELETN